MECVLFAIRTNGKTNAKKHGIDLVQASQAFTDPFAVTAYDTSHSAEEDRYQIIGKMDDEVLIFVSYTMRHETVRVISARKAESREEKFMPDNKKITMLDGNTFEDMTDYQRLATMTEEELLGAAQSDPDAQPITDERLRSFRRLPDVPGGNFIDRVRALSSENKTLLSVRYDNDIVRFFKGQGKGYQRLMNNVLRAYMEAHQEAGRESHV